MVRLVVALVVFLSIPTSVLAQATPTPTPSISSEYYDYEQLLREKQQSLGCGRIGISGTRPGWAYALTNYLCIDKLVYRAACVYLPHDPALGEYSPDPGLAWIGCTYVVTSWYDDRIVVVGPLQFRLVDERGTTFPLTLKPVEGVEYLVGSAFLGPGEETLGFLFFELPADVSLPLFLIVKSLEPQEEPGVIIIEAFADIPYIPLN